MRQKAPEEPLQQAWCVSPLPPPPSTAEGRVSAVARAREHSDSERPAARKATMQTDDQRSGPPRATPDRGSLYTRDGPTVTPTPTHTHPATHTSTMSGANVGMMAPAFFVGRKQILDWLNATLSMQLEKIEETASGAVACQLLDAIFPDALVPMAKVRAKKGGMTRRGGGLARDARWRPGCRGAVAQSARVWYCCRVGDTSESAVCHWRA